MRLTLIHILFALCLISSPASAEEEQDGSAMQRPLIAVSFSFLEDGGRWSRDVSAMRDYASDHNLDILVEVARNNQMQQNIQVARLLTHQPDVLIICPQDAASAASAVKNVRDQGVKVILYDRLVLNAEADLYVSFDSELVGRMQGLALAEAAPSGNFILLSGSPTDHNSLLLFNGAMEVLGPLIETGRIKVVARQPIIDWTPSLASQAIEKVLAEGVSPAAVLAPNDQLAGGVIAALEKRGLAGRVAVTGQDADLAGAQRVAQGTQLMTVFKDTSLLAATAMESAAKMAHGDLPDYNAYISNGLYSVPSIRLIPIAVNSDNLVEALIDNGYLLYDEVFDPTAEMKDLRVPGNR